jgi:hypothetical protein
LTNSDPQFVLHFDNKFTLSLSLFFTSAFQVHGSRIPGCPHKRPLFFLPFLIGSAMDAVAKWISSNSKWFYCYVCAADYRSSRVYHPAAQVLPERGVEPVAGLRRRANTPAVSNDDKADVLQARAALRAAHVHPELTADDALMAEHTGGSRNAFVDSLHTVDSILKHGAKGVKRACDDSAAVAGTGHSVKAVAAVVNDHVASGGLFSNGCHSLPGVYNFLGMESFTAMSVRTCVFSLLATLCSVRDLFTHERQTAMVLLFTACVLLLQNTNQRIWDPAAPDRLDAIFELLAQHWEPAVGKWVRFLRPIVHLPSHWRQQYRRLGTPVHWTTKDFIEMLMHYLRAAYLRTNKVNPEEQIMTRIGLVRYVETVVEPTLRGSDDDPDDDVAAALKQNRRTEAYLRGTTVRAVAGCNKLFSAPSDAAQAAFNGDYTRAMKACAGFLKSPKLPTGHDVANSRIHPRNSCFVSRRGIVARSVPAYPGRCSETGIAEHAIFSVYEQPAEAAAGVAAAAAAPASQSVESADHRFIVDAWISYDVRGLSAASPNAPLPDEALTLAQMNGDDCIDFAIGRWLAVVPSVTGSGYPERDEAGAILQRVKPVGAGKLQILELKELCQPLWTFPWLKNFDTAKAFFASGRSTKWDADQWLVCPKLY